MIKETAATYTGGNIYLFSGKTSDGNYFFVDDYGSSLILDTDSRSDWDNCCYEEWQKEHLIKELNGKELEQFQKELIKTLSNLPYEKRGCINDQELDGYLQHWKE